MINRIIHKINTFRRRLEIKKYPDKGNIILILVPYGHIVNGGVLSIANIYNTLKKHKNLHNCDVILSYLFLDNTYNPTQFTQFKNPAFIQDIRTVFNHFDSFEKLQIHIPECYIKNLITEIENRWPQKFIEKLKTAKDLTINILNQNDEYMDDVTNIKWLKNNITENITMTMAHRKYTTIEKRKEYDTPIHHLSAWLNNGSYTKKKFSDKKNIILFSPDEINNSYSKEKFYKKDLIETLAKDFPHYSLIEIKNFSYERYKKLISDAKFMITFGEGLDGYFIENSFCGGVSFAFYNHLFFTENYKNISTIYNSYHDLFNKISQDIKSLDNEQAFEEKNNEILNEVQKEYSFEIFEKKLIRFLKKDFDFM